MGQVDAGVVGGPAGGVHDHDQWRVVRAGRRYRHHGERCVRL
ncbi:hypothetical protein ACLQ28_11035 [Micromonospora sp. DT201]